MSIYKLQKMERRGEQFDRLAKMWGNMSAGPQRDQVQELYKVYTAQKGHTSFDGEALERAFMEVMEETDRSREAVDAGAAEYEEIMAIQGMRDNV